MQVPVRSAPAAGPEDRYDNSDPCKAPEQGPRFRVCGPAFEGGGAGPGRKVVRQLNARDKVLHTANPVPAI